MGRFIGEADLRLLSDGRSMQLLEDLKFSDASGQVWMARRGDIIDGASIPRFFWRFIGPPFVGKYRRASIIHDVYCNSEVVDSPKVHEMFWEAMRADQTPIIQAVLMWLAVRLFGPRFKGCHQ